MKLHSLVILMMVCIITNAQDSTKSKAYIWGSLSPNKWFSTQCFGIAVHVNRNVFNAGFYEYNEFNTKFAPDEIPFKVESSKSLAASYGLEIPVTHRGMSFIISAGLGYTRGYWRTSQLDSSGSSGMLFSGTGPDYKEVSYKGISILPQVELMVSSPRIGLSAGYLPMIFPDNLRYSTHQVFLKLAIGKL